MKRLLSYTFLMVLASFVVSSCINEKFDDGRKPLQTSLSLKLCFPDDGTRAAALPGDGSNTPKPTPETTETGNPYENTIPSASFIRIFLFDFNTGDFLTEVEDLEIDFSHSERYIKNVSGNIPSIAYDKHVRMVFMANYETRMNVKYGNPLVTPFRKKYDDWKANLTFAYNSQDNEFLATQPKDSFLIPMSGEADFTVSKYETNTVNVDIVRALAKVRLHVKDGSAYRIQTIFVSGSAGTCYCFAKPKDAHGDIIIPNNNHGSDRQFAKVIEPGSDLEFYVAEQSLGKLQVFFNLCDVKTGKESIPARLDFKWYPNGAAYPVERNYLYVFNINKNAESPETPVDVTTSIMPWRIKDINTNFE